jgi:hypothetical protein
MKKKSFPRAVRLTVLIEGITPLVVHRFVPERYQRRAPCLYWAAQRRKEQKQP